MARYLNLSETRLLVLRPGYVFTWFGQLHNAVLANCLGLTGVASKPKSFGIDLGRNVDCDSFLDVLRRSVESIENCLIRFEFPLETIADCRAHHSLLGSQQRDQCRTDWVDVKFLRQWIDRIDTCQTLAGDDSRLEHLRLLARV